MLFSLLLISLLLLCLCDGRASKDPLGGLGRGGRSQGGFSRADAVARFLAFTCPHFGPVLPRPGVEAELANRGKDHRPPRGDPKGGSKKRTFEWLKSDLTMTLNCFFVGSHFCDFPSGDGEQIRVNHNIGSISNHIFQLILFLYHLSIMIPRRPCQSRDRRACEYLSDGTKRALTSAFHLSYFILYHDMLHYSSYIAVISLLLWLW